MKNTHLISWLGLCCAALIFLPTTAAHARDSPIIFGELAWAGSSRSTVDEWIELWNLSDDPKPIGSWQIQWDTTHTTSLPSDAIIPGHGTYLIANYGASNDKSILAIEPDLVDTQVSLSNDQLQLKLVDQNSAVIDEIGDGNKPFADSSTPDKRSMLRVQTEHAGTDPSAWTSATTSQNLKPDPGNWGTPGVCDQCADATSTDDASTSTIEDPDLPPDETTSSTTSTEENSNSPNPSSINSEPEPVEGLFPKEGESSSSQILVHYESLRLNEISPHPDSGAEWVELVSLDHESNIPLTGCELWDGTGRIYKFTDGIIDPATSTISLVYLPKTALNNSGDTVSLYDPKGSLLDTFRFMATDVNESWIRSPNDFSLWQKSKLQTPGEKNDIEIPPAPAISSSSIVTTSASSAKEDTEDLVDLRDDVWTDEDWNEPIVDAEDGWMNDPDQEIQSFFNEYLYDTAHPTTNNAGKKSTTGTTIQSATVARRGSGSGAGTRAPQPRRNNAPVKKFLSVTFDTLMDQSVGISLRIQGTVGSPPGLMSPRGFVLLAEDGRGIFVSPTKSQPLPALNANVQLTGSLRQKDDGSLWIQMLTADRWTALPTSTEPTPRIVDLVTPSAEDQWSLVSVTGTIQKIKGQLATLDIGETDVELLIKPIIKYRAGRLVVGDQLTIRGVLDRSKEIPRILPRIVEDIRLNQHRSLAIASPNAKPPPNILPVQRLPDWVPIGSAIGAITMTEGAKRLVRRHRRKKLEKKMRALPT